jgi:hypothetical protein
MLKYWWGSAEQSHIHVLFPILLELERYILLPSFLDASL